MLSNYGIKRLLPRLVIAAILVNLSYYICQAAVDISNIVGASVYSFFDATLVTSASDPSSAASAGAWGEIFKAVLAVGVIGVGLVLAIATGVAGLIALILIVLILIARQAVLLLMVVISPIAFVAYLLPNTESWFKKWWKIFWTLLMVFPVVGVIFGASQLAAEILSSQKGDEMQLMGLGVSVLPLFAVPIVLKGALSAAGAIGQRLQGMADNSGKLATGRGKEYAKRQGNRAVRRALTLNDREGRLLGEKNSGRRRAAAWLSGRTVGAAVTRDKMNEYAKIGADAAKRGYFADRAESSEKYAQRVAGDSQMTGLVQSYAVQAQEEEFNKDTQAAQVLLRNHAKGMSADDYREHLKSTIMSGSADLHERVAAMNEYGSVASDEKVEELTNHIANLGATSSDANEKVKMQRAFASSFGDRMPINVGATDKSDMQSGNFTTDEGTRIQYTVGGGKISSGHIGRMKFDEMVAWNKKLADEPELLGNVKADKIQAVYNSIVEAENDPRVNVNFGNREKSQLATMKVQLEKQWMIAEARQSGS